MFLSYYHHSWGFKSHQCGCGIGKVYKLSRSGFVRTLQHPPPAYGKQPIGPACWLGLIFQWEDTREQEKVPQLQSEYLIILIGTSEYLGLLQVFLSIWIKKPHWPNGNKAFVKTLPSLIVSTSRPTNIYIYIFQAMTRNIDIQWRFVEKSQACCRSFLNRAISGYQELVSNMVLHQRGDTMTFKPSPPPCARI